MKKKSITFFKIITGAFVGFINGFFGGGGGMVCVPMLEHFSKLKSKNAHATSMLIILPISVVSAVIYLINNSIKFMDIFIVSFGVLLGGIVGAFLLKKLPQKFIVILFCFLMFVSGIKMIF